MEQKYGKLVWTDEDDLEKAHKAMGTENFLDSMGVADAEQAMEDITGVFMGNGTMRGRIFYNGSFQAFDRAGVPLRLPVYGVKGEHREKSISHYAHWYINKEEDLLGTGFFHTIFSKYFGTEEEYRTLKNPEEMFGRESESVLSEADSWHKLLSLQITGKLWMALESNPSARFVIVLPSNGEGGEEAERKADEESLNILEQVYQLIPQRLRLTLGFATCVTPEEMIRLAEREDLPIHIFTTDKVSGLKVLENAGYVYDIFQIDKKEEYLYDSGKQSFLEELLKYQSKGWLEELLDRSEEEYLRKENNAICFGAYGAILDPIVVPWYDKDKENKLFDLLKYREEQEAVLACGDMEKERKRFFLGEILPQKNYDNQLVDYMLNYKAQSGKNQEENQDEYQDSMWRIREKLGLGFLADIIERISEFWQKSYEWQIKKAETARKEKEEEVRKLGALINEKSLQISQLEKKISEMKKRNDTLNEDIITIQGQNKEFNAKIEEQANQYAELERKYQDLVSTSTQQQEKLQKTIVNLENTNGELRKGNKVLEEKNRQINEVLEKKKEQEELRQHYLNVINNLEENDRNQDQRIQMIYDTFEELRKENKMIFEDLRKDNDRMRKQLEELGQDVKLIKEKGKVFNRFRKKSVSGDRKKEEK